MTDLRLVIALILAGVALAVVLTFNIAGLHPMVEALAAALGTTDIGAGLIGSTVLVGLSVAAFVLSLKRRSFLVAGLLASSGIIFLLSPMIVPETPLGESPEVHTPATAAGGAGIIHYVSYGLAVLGLGVAKGVGAAKMRVAAASWLCMTNSKLMLVLGLVGAALALDLTNLIGGLAVGSYSVLHGPPHQVLAISTVVLAAAAFIISWKRRSFPIAGLLAATGVIGMIPGLIALANVNFAVIVFPGPISGVIYGLMILGLGVAKGIRTAKPVTVAPRWYFFGSIMMTKRSIVIYAIIAAAAVIGAIVAYLLLVGHTIPAHDPWISIDEFTRDFEDPCYYPRAASILQYMTIKRRKTIHILDPIVLRSQIVVEEYSHSTKNLI
jgi:hypothetical protein